jgi:hypothetical protein
MKPCIIKGVGISAPGLAGWTASREILNGAGSYLPTAEPDYSSTLLPPNERRRATGSVRQAFRAAEDAMGGRPVDHIASVFVSSDADMTVLHRICFALAQSPRVISPTDFHNSVHNAASGYWGIASRSMAPSTTLCGHDASFVTGLLEAVAMVNELGADVLLVAYDTIAPSPLLAHRTLGLAAGVALWLGVVSEAGHEPQPTLQVSLGDAAETTLTSAALEQLRGANPALRALPLLQLLARRRAGLVTLCGAGDVRINVACGP